VSKRGRALPFLNRITAPIPQQFALATWGVLFLEVSGQLQTRFEPGLLDAALSIEQRFQPDLFFTRKQPVQGFIEGTWEVLK
jgi:hypothetical protein